MNVYSKLNPVWICLLPGAVADRIPSGPEAFTPMDWAVALAYAIAGLLCSWAAWRTWRKPPVKLGRRAAVFWLSCGTVLLFLSLGKLLNIQTPLVEFVRETAKAGGWYQGRRALQVGFMVTLAMGGIGGLGFIAWLIRGARLPYYLAMMGMVFTGCYVVIRAASFHQIDQWLAYEIGGVSASQLVEFGGIFVLGVSALAHRLGTSSAGTGPAPNDNASAPTAEPPEDGTGISNTPNTVSNTPPPLHREEEGKGSKGEPTYTPTQQAPRVDSEDPITTDSAAGEERGDEEGNDDGSDLPEIIILD